MTLSSAGAHPGYEMAAIVPGTKAMTSGLNKNVSSCVILFKSVETLPKLPQVVLSHFPPLGQNCVKDLDKPHWQENKQ